MSATRDVAVTLAGGGNRAFYEYGLLTGWAGLLAPRLAGLACCSAGAAVAVMWLTGRRAAARDVFRARTRGLTRNVDLARALRGEPVAPHGAIYREILLAMLADGGFERLRAAPFPVHVTLSAFPSWWPAAFATLLGICAYQAEKALRPHRVHPSFGRALGFAPVVVDLRTCESPDEVAALVLASSATPPFTPVGRFRGHRYLDGGMVDNVPAFAGDALPGVRRNLVLLSRPYPAGVTGQQGHRFYVAPRLPLPVGRWDYTRPDSVDLAVFLGEQDAAARRAELTAFLDRPVSGEARGGWLATPGVGVPASPA